MAAESVRARTALIERLRRDGRSFDFVQMAILMERLHGSEDKLRTYRFKTRTRLTFQSAECELQELPDPDQGKRGAIHVNGFGVSGLLGPLPAYYSELAEYRREAYDDTAFASFLSIFDDRLTGLLVEAHKRGRFWLTYAARGRLGDLGEDAFQRMLVAIAGTLGSDSHRRCGMFSICRQASQVCQLCTPVLPAEGVFV